jgi:hypothetical protein
MMDNIFYFSDKNLTLSHIEKIAKELGFLTDYWHLNTGTTLKITYQGGPDSNEYWECFYMRKDTVDFVDFTPDAIERIVNSGAVSVFMISLRPASLEQLRNFLKRVLQEHGGWIGGEADDLEPIYTLDNNDELWYPYFERNPAVIQEIREATIRAKLKQWSSEGHNGSSDR